ncbi:MAG: hypothetical protein Q9217_006824 [Psora testacea]
MVCPICYGFLLPTLNTSFTPTLRYPTKTPSTKEPIYPPSDSSAGAPPPGPPPGYIGGDSSYPAEKGSLLGTNNPYSSTHSGSSSQNLNEDERLARQLQAEEDARARAAGGPRPNTFDRGEADSFYGQQQGQGSGYPLQQPASYDQQQLPPREHKKGGLSGLLGKLGGKHSASHQQGYPQQGYGGYPPQQQYGGYPQQGYGGGYGNPSPGAYGAPPGKHGGRGMGAAGGAALGLGGGLVGGALLANAFDGGDGGGHGGEYGGGDYGGGDDGGGGDYGGGDDGGGGDFGGDGGGDGGGGDGGGGD